MHWRLNKHFCLITIRCDIQSFFKRHTFRLTMIQISRRVQDKAHGIGPFNPGEKKRNNMEIRIPKFTWGSGVFQCLLNRGEGDGVGKEKKLKWSYNAVICVPEQLSRFVFQMCFLLD